MKKIIALVIVVLLAEGLCFAADPVEGYWISYDEKTNQPTAGWHIYTENSLLYGKIVSVYGKPQDELATSCKESYKGYPTAGKVNQQKGVGSIWIFGLKMNKEGEWKGGRIIDPKDGKMYDCKVTFRYKDGKKYTEDTLEMRCEIGLGIGRNQFWKEASQEQAESIR